MLRELRLGSQRRCSPVFWRLDIWKIFPERALVGLLPFCQTGMAAQKSRLIRMMPEEETPTIAGTMKHER
jgi:hypothetical protein